MRQTATSKPEVISAIRAVARRLKRTPTRSEFQSMSGIHWTKVQRLFGGYRAAVREAGLEPDPGGIRIGTAAMLLDFGRVARRVKRHPTRDEYEKLGKYASASLENRFRRWSAMRERFLEYVAGNGLEREWGDVAESLRNGPAPRRGGGKAWLKTVKALPRIGADERGSGANPTPLKRRGKKEAEEVWGAGPPERPDAIAAGAANLLPQMNTDEHGSKPFLRRINANTHRTTETQVEGGRTELSGVSEQNCRSEVDDADNGRLPQVLKPEFQQEGCCSCNPRVTPKPEPIRAEILYPQLRGMHCVTNVMLWVMSGYQNAAPEEANGGSTANGGDGLVRAQPRASEIQRTDRSVCTTQSNSAEIFARGASLFATQSHPDEAIRADRSVCATQFWAASAELASHFPKRVFPGRPLMGPPFLPQPRNLGASGELALMLHGMAYEPVNEMGVVFLFGMVAPLVGFRVEALQTGFPDCKAKLEVEPGRWQDVNVEFEFESRKFRDHHHDPLKCDVIVCWRHNWKGCPERIQVVELSRILGVR